MGLLRRKLTVTYLLEDTVLFGGVKVVLRQADLLARRGHRVTVVSKGPRPEWYELIADFRQVPLFSHDLVPPSDVIVATYWTTIEPAVAADRGPVLHYCQGYEGSYTHNVEDHPAIEQVYSTKLPTMVVSPHLATQIARDFKRPSRVVPQPLERFFKPSRGWRWRRVPSEPPRILVTGPFECDWKGIPTALEAVGRMRNQGRTCTLVRMSQLPLTGEEQRVVEADEFHYHLTPLEAADLIRGCDLTLAPSWEQEGFGLPVLESMASAVPVVASDISSFRGFVGDAAPLVAPRRPDLLAKAATEVLFNSTLWRGLRAAGLAVAREFREDRATSAAEKTMLWVADGRWRSDLESLARSHSKTLDGDGVVPEAKTSNILLGQGNQEFARRRTPVRRTRKLAD